MKHNLNNFFRSIAGQFERNELPAIAQKFVYPHAICFEDENIILSSPEEFVLALASYRRGIIGRGMVQVQSRVVGQSLPRNGRQTIWQLWTSIGRDGRAISQSQIRYFLSENALGGLQIELWEYLKTRRRSIIKELPKLAVAT